jgi:hypothetical protein
LDALRNAEISPATSTACKGEKRGRAPAENVHFATGRGVSPQVRLPDQRSTRSERIKRAIAVEPATRWPSLRHSKVAPKFLRRTAS